MAIPNGTKFHGVASFVDTENRGSAQLNAQRDAYEFPADFKDLVQISYNGKIINLGAGATAPFNGDTVEWGGIASPTSQTAAIIFPYAVKIQSIYFKMTEIITGATGDFNYVFNLYTAASLAADPNLPTTWTQLGALTTELDDVDNNTAPGFVEDLSGQDLIIPAGSMFAMAGIELAGSITSTTSEAVLGIVVTKA
tara:strand:- start:3870 stop:4457 length:588 start_codon:yes stop_codon:yes gene_type:complete